MVEYQPHRIDTVTKPQGNRRIKGEVVEREDSTL
jgi:hypothetical protein